jgi:poly-gamma-glutamate synthesis protein (capsule biosynthesis protein)
MKLGRVVLLVIVFVLLASAIFGFFYYWSRPEDQAVMKEGSSVSEASESSSNSTSSEQATWQDNESPKDNSNSVEETDTVEELPEPEPVIEEPPVPELRFMAVGDIMIGRGVAMRLKKMEGVYGRAFEKISFYMNKGDVVFANLESPFTDSTHCLDKDRKIVLKAEPEAVTALKDAGINLISLSNNHIMDYYEKGLFDTMELLDQNDIKHAGGGRNIEEARKPAIMEKNGLKIAMLAYTDMAELTFAGKPYLSFAAGPEKSGVVPRKYETIRDDIQKYRDQVDLLAISLHWGVEDSFNVPVEQIEFAHRLIDDGADMILGHHPHRAQGIEIYKGKPIFYSLGNFLFDQNDKVNMESFIIDMKYKGTEMVGCVAIPVRIAGKTTVEVLTGQDAVGILERQTELSRRLGTEPQTVFDKLVYK